MSCGSSYDSEVGAVVRRIAALPTAERLRIFTWQREHEDLGDVRISLGDQRLLERDGALEAIRDSARRYELPVGEWPTRRQFDNPDQATAVEGWNSKRVIRAWGRWLFAVEKLRSGHENLTPEQQAALRRAAGKHSSYESAWESLRRWLRTEPRIDEDAYERWARAENTRSDITLLVLGASGLRNTLVMPFLEAVRVASGEIELEDAASCGRIEKATWSKGPHDFVSRPQVARLLGLTEARMRTLIRQVSFPRAVLALGATLAWLREDVEAFRDHRPFPAREPGELSALYIDVHGLAEVLHVTPNAIRQPKSSSPAPSGAICGKLIWFRPEVEDWLKLTPPSAYSGRARYERGKAPAELQRVARSAA